MIYRHYGIFNNTIMSITLYSHKNDTQIVLSYIYELLDRDIDCEWINIESKHYRDYKKDNSDYIFLHTFIPVNGKYVINNIEIEICDFVLNDKVQTINIDDDDDKIIFLNNKDNKIPNECLWYFYGGILKDYFKIYFNKLIFIICF